MQLKPNACIFAINRSRERRLNAFDKSVSDAPNDLPLSLQNFDFSNMATEQCWALNIFESRTDKWKRFYRQKMIFDYTKASQIFSKKLVKC